MIEAVARFKEQNLEHTKGLKTVKVAFDFLKQFDDLPRARMYELTHHGKPIYHED